MEKTLSKYSIRCDKSSFICSDNMDFNRMTLRYYEHHFNDVLRNLTAAITTLRENTKVLYIISKNNNEMKTLAENTMEKINDIETDIKK